MRSLRSIRFAFIICSTALGASLTACGGNGVAAGTGPSNNPGGGNNGGGNSTSNAITVQDNSFTPASTTVAAGTTITWTFAGSVDHNVTFASGTNSGNRSSGTFARAFPTAGTFPYECTLHAGMTGTIIVQ